MYAFLFRIIFAVELYNKKLTHLLLDISKLLAQKTQITSHTFISDVS